MHDLPQVLEDFMVDVAGDSKIGSRETQTWYDRRMRQLIQWLQDREYIDPFTPRRFKQYVAFMKQRELSPYTLCGHISILKRFGRWLVQEGHVQEDPTAVLGKPHLPDLLPKAISPKDVHRVTAVARTESIPTLSIVLFLRDTGVRASEMTKIRWKHLDLEGLNVFVTGKSGKMRYVFFTKTTAEILRRHREMMDYGPDDPVFWGPRKPISVQSLWRLLGRLGRESGTQGPVNPHAWRHAFGRDMTCNGCPTLALQNLMGHSSPRVTEIYSRLNTRQMQTVYDRYADW